MDLWYTEKHSENVGLSLRVKRTLFSGESEYQRIDILDTYEYGRALLLDGLIMATERDEFIYHEMLVHPALFTHPAPRQVLVIGGGDGSTVREVVRHPEVEQVVLCETDEMVIDKAVEFLPSMASEIDGSNPRVVIEIGDGDEFVKTRRASFDIILVDATSPAGATGESSENDFYSHLALALKQDGILIAQSESPFYHGDMQQSLFGGLRSLFPIVEMYHAFVPSYPSGFWSFAFASKTHHPTRDNDRDHVAQRTFPTGYYNEEVHFGAFMLPNFVRENIVDRRSKART